MDVRFADVGHDGTNVIIPDLDGEVRCIIPQIIGGMEMHDLMDVIAEAKGLLTDHPHLAAVQVVDDWNNVVIGTARPNGWSWDETFANPIGT